MIREFQKSFDALSKFVGEPMVLTRACATFCTNEMHPPHVDVSEQMKLKLDLAGVNKKEADIIAKTKTGETIEIPFIEAGSEWQGGYSIWFVKEVEIPEKLCIRTTFTVDPELGYIPTIEQHEI